MTWPTWFAARRGNGSVLVPLFLLLAACTPAGPGGNEATPTSAESSSAESSSAEASTSAAQSAPAALGELCPPGQEGGAPVEPGAHLASHLAPAISLTVPEGTWTIDCGDEMFLLGGELGAVAVVGDVRAILRGGEANEIEPSVDAAVAMLTELGVDFTEPLPADIANGAVELTVTSDETGVGFRNELRGWAWSVSEFEMGIVTLVPAGDTLLVLVRHSDDSSTSEVASSLVILD